MSDNTAQKSAQNAIQKASEKLALKSTNTALKKGLALTGKALSKIALFGPDIAFAAQGIADTTQSKMSDARKATQIVGEVGGAIVNIGTNVLAILATGPIAIFIMVAQLVGMVLDLAWNPYKNYYNDDLVAVKESIDSDLKKGFNADGMNWPLETKPNFMASLDESHPDFQTNLKLYFDLKKKYFDDNGIIESEDVKKEESTVVNDISSLRKMRRVYNTTDGENLILMDPVSASISMADSANMNMLELLPLAVKAKRMKELGLLRRRNIFKTINNFFSVNLPLFISSLLIIIFLFVVIIKYIKDNV